MHTRALDLAAAVVANANRSKPADAVLRSTLKAERGLSRTAAAEASRAVFSYYRWLGWVRNEPPRTGIQRALELADRFKSHPETFSDDDLVSRALPPWLSDQLDISTALARAMQTEPKLWLRARPGTGREVCRQLGACRQFGSGPLADTLHFFGSDDLFREAAFQEGRYEIQDISSQAVGLVCAPKPEETWWDACAGEGGKTLHISDLMANKGLIWASDSVEWRLKSLKRRAARAGVFNYRVALWNGSAKLPTKTKFDGVLVDAPCSGIGTWQRNPHARWTITAEDIKELASLQMGLLRAAAAALKPGGRLIYSVCTLARAETTNVAEELERGFPQLSPFPLENPLRKGGGAPVAASASSVSPPLNHLWLYPQDFGGNGMFVAAWKRSDQ